MTARALAAAMFASAFVLALVLLRPQPSPTITDDVENAEPPPLGAAEIGRVLTALEETSDTWRPGRGFWIAGASVSLLSFTAGAVLMLASLSSSGALDLALALADVASGGGEIGGLM